MRGSRGYGVQILGRGGFENATLLHIGARSQAGCSVLMRCWLCGSQTRAESRDATFAANGLWIGLHCPQMLEHFTLGG